MDPISPIAFGALLALPFHLVVRRYVAVHTDPALLREKGVVIVHDRDLTGPGELYLDPGFIYRVD